MIAWCSRDNLPLSVCGCDDGADQAWGTQEAKSATAFTSPETEPPVTPPFACCFWNLDQPTERGRKDALDLCLATSGGCSKTYSEKGLAAAGWIDPRTDPPSLTRWQAENERENAV